MKEPKKEGGWGMGSGLVFWQGELFMISKNGQSLQS